MSSSELTRGAAARRTVVDWACSGCRGKLDWRGWLVLAVLLGLFYGLSRTAHQQPKDTAASPRRNHSTVDLSEPISPGTPDGAGAVSPPTPDGIPATKSFHKQDPGASKEQKARENVTLFSCMISSPHPSGLKIVSTSCYWKSQGSNLCLGSETYTSLKNLVTEDASLQLLVVQLQDKKYYCQMVNTSSKSQESILLKFLAQPNSTVDAHENIMITCTPSFSPWNTFSVNCTLRRKPSEEDSRALYRCPDTKLTPLPGGEQRSHQARRKRRRRNPQQSVHSENYSMAPTESTVAGSDVPTPPSP